MTTIARSRAPRPQRRKPLPPRTAPFSAPPNHPGNTGRARRARRVLAALGVAVHLLTVTATAYAEDAVGVEPRGDLSLRDALGLAIALSPELQSFSAEVRAREAHEIQAGRLPNPQLHTEVENVGGSGTRAAFDDTETTLRLSQLVEFGGKRAERRRVAALGSALAGWDYEAKRLHVLSETSKAFVRALAAQERVTLAGELERIAGEAVRAADAQVAAGGAPAVESMRATVALEKAMGDRRHAEQELRALRGELAAHWAETQPAFTQVRGNLAAIAAPPPTDELERRLDATPDVARWATEIEERRAALRLEQAERIPDLTVGAGGRHFSDTGDNAMVLELSIPLPVFNRNDGAIAEAEHRLAKATADGQAASVSAHATLLAAAARLTAAWEQERRLRTRVLPRATAALDGARDAYRKGLFRAVDVLDAQRTLFELRGEHLAALENYHLIAADLSRLAPDPGTDAGSDGGTR